MSINKPSDEEKQYFAQQEVERRKTAEYNQKLADLREQEINAVIRTLGITDRKLGGELVDMGFGGQTVGIFPLIPLVYVAWADGEVSNAELNQILDVAQARGADTKSAGYLFLSELLHKEPRPDFFDTCIKTLRAVHNNLPADQAQTASQDLISLSLSVANASGGFLGLFGDKISDEEKAMINEIIQKLKLDNTKSASDLMNLL